MMLSLVLTGFLLVFGLQTNASKASQETDAAVIVAMFADPEIFERRHRYDLWIDGCSARFDNGRRSFRTLLTSINYVAWKQGNGGNTIQLNEDAQRQVRAFKRLSGPWPLSPPDRFSFDDAVTPDRQRELDGAMRRNRLNYFESLLRGDFGDWYAEHHGYSLEGGFVGDFRPISEAPVRIVRDRKSTIADAMRDYASKYCLPAPDYTCTKFFVNERGTLCTGRDRANE